MSTPEPSAQTAKSRESHLHVLLMWRKELEEAESVWKTVRHKRKIPAFKDSVKIRRQKAQQTVAILEKFDLTDGSVLPELPSHPDPMSNTPEGTDTELMSDREESMEVSDSRMTTMTKPAEEDTMNIDGVRFSSDKAGEKTRPDSDNIDIDSGRNRAFSVIESSLRTSTPKDLTMDVDEELPRNARKRKLPNELGAISENCPSNGSPQSTSCLEQNKAGNGRRVSSKEYRTNDASAFPEADTATNDNRVAPENPILEETEDRLEKENKDKDASNNERSRTNGNSKVIVPAVTANTVGASGHNIPHEISGSFDVNGFTHTSAWSETNGASYLGAGMPLQPNHGSVHTVGAYAASNSSASTAVPSQSEVGSFIFPDNMSPFQSATQSDSLDLSLLMATSSHFYQPETEQDLFRGLLVANSEHQADESGSRVLPNMPERSPSPSSSDGWNSNDVETYPPNKSDGNIEDMGTDADGDMDDMQLVKDGDFMDGDVKMQNSEEPTPSTVNPDEYKAIEAAALKDIPNHIMEVLMYDFEYIPFVYKSLPAERKVQIYPTETKIDFRHREKLHTAELHFKHDQAQADELRRVLKELNTISIHHGGANVKCLQLRNKLTVIERKLGDLQKAVDKARAGYEDRMEKLSTKKRINMLDAESKMLVKELSTPNNKAVQEKLNKIVVEKSLLETDKEKDDETKKKAAVPALATYLKKDETEKEKWIKRAMGYLDAYNSATTVEAQRSVIRQIDASTRLALREAQCFCPQYASTSLEITLCALSVGKEDGKGRGEIDRPDSTVRNTGHAFPRSDIPEIGHLHCGCEIKTAVLEFFIWKTFKVFSSNPLLRGICFFMTHKEIVNPRVRCVLVYCFLHYSGLTVDDIFGGRYPCGTREWDARISTVIAARKITHLVTIHGIQDVLGCISNIDRIPLAERSYAMAQFLKYTGIPFEHMFKDNLPSHGTVAWNGRLAALTVQAKIAELSEQHGIDIRIEFKTPEDKEKMNRLLADN